MELLYWSELLFLLLWMELCRGCARPESCAVIYLIYNACFALAQLSILVSLKSQYTLTNWLESQYTLLCVVLSLSLSIHTNKLVGVMWRVLQGPRAVQQ